MGGDQPPDAIFEAVYHVAQKGEAHFALFVTEASARNFPSHPHIDYVYADQVIEMEESPLLAVRRKKKSTMAEGLRHLKGKKIDAFLTTGNTGALVALALFHLNTLPGVERPALLVTMPTAKGEVVVLDVGANISPKPHQLVTYAKLGQLYRTCFHQLERPTLGLLNIGTEQQKGTREVKLSYHLLESTFGSHFLGNIEGCEVFQGKVDVLVTDGFTGNIFLKASEGISHFFLGVLPSEMAKELSQTFDYAAHPGALLCGVDGIVVKCHGYSDRRALINGIEGALELARHQVISKMKSHLAS